MYHPSAPKPVSSLVSGRDSAQASVHVFWGSGLSPQLVGSVQPAVLSSSLEHTLTSCEAGLMSHTQPCG